MKAGRPLAAPRTPRVPGPRRSDSLLRAALQGCDLKQLEVFISKCGGELAVRNHIPLAPQSPVGARKALAHADGRTVNIKRRGAPVFHQIWAAGHCFAHMIQWHTPRASRISPAFRIGGKEAQRWSIAHLHLLTGPQLARAVRQELEAHLLTSAVLAACYSEKLSTSLAEAAMAKAYDDLFLLSIPRHGGNPRAAQIWRLLRRFDREVHELPKLETTPQLRRLSGHFIPYLLLSR